MGEIIVYGDPGNHAKAFEPALDALEFTERRTGDFRGDPGLVRRGNRRERVFHVVTAEQVPFHHSNRIPRAMTLETGIILPLWLCSPITLALGETLRCGPATHREDIAYCLVLSVDDDPSCGRHRSDQIVKLAFDRLQVPENIRVVKFYIVDDQSTRAIMNELGALIEECGIVLVGLDHEQIALAGAS